MNAVFRAVLAVIIAANLLGLANLVLDRAGLLARFPEMRPWMIPALGLLSIASVVAAGALWQWKRWGFALIGVAYLLMLAINLGFSAPAAHTALGPLGLLVLAAAAWPVRRRFGRTE